MAETDHEIVSKYFAAMDFMQKELQFHQKYIADANDYQSYIISIKLEAEKNFPELNSNPTPQPPPTVERVSKIA